MLHHISLPVADVDKAAELYDAVLPALGYKRVCSGAGFAGYGIEDGKDKLLLVQVASPRPAGPGFHLAIAAPSPESVDRFHELAVAHGARSNGSPGLRPHYGPSYYAAFIEDADGHRIEAVINDPIG